MPLFYIYFKLLELIFTKLQNFLGHHVQNKIRVDF